VASFVLVVSPDERWLRVLEVTLRVGGFTPIARRSVVEALRQREGDERPQALVLDFGTESTAREVEAVREVLGSGEIPAIVILPERLSKQQEAFRASGVKVIVRPYAPSVLYQALKTPAQVAAEAAVAEATAAAQPGATGPPSRAGRTEPSRKPFVPRPGYTADDI
jgi:DNA-binding NtrC family response regulator